jgi:nucleotide-binding universal stress UspA family protein
VERLIKERGIDLVVSGTHGRGDLKKVVIGSVAEEVFRQAGCAVLTVGPQVRKQAPHEVELNNILFATDFGLGAARAAKYAFSLAQEYGARLTVLRVVEELRAHSREEEERVRKVNVQHMMEFMPAGSEDWCKVDFRVAFGAPVEEILDEARETGADLIIMGAKTSRAFPGHAPLTIAYNVVAKAKCPVLTVRG